MLILQFQCVNFTDTEINIVPEFCQFVIQNIGTEMNTKVNRKKIDLRLNYIQSEVDWVNWDKNKKYETTSRDLMRAMFDSLIANEYKDNVWKIETDDNVLIPNSYTSIDRFIRFLNYGDNKAKATGIFSKMEKDYDHNKLMRLWRFYYFNKYYEMPTMEIIAK